MTVHWKAVEQCFTEARFVSQFSPVVYFGKFINFRLGTDRSERVQYLNNNFPNSFLYFSLLLKIYHLNGKDIIFERMI